ncbi:MAG: prepilin-type N-terminal cleavage/methylation domain-containing protein [Sedimentisphaerales bacterium]
MRQNSKKKCCLSSQISGFTLAEAIVTLAIAAVIMVTAMGIYTGVKRAEAAINKRLESGFTATEILQRITEDIDRLALPSSDVTLTIKNKIEEGGYKSSQMIIESKIYDKDNKPQTFEKIVWQSHPDADANGLVIYRAHSGYTLEDKMLDEPKEKYERERYIPISSGVTLFSITAGADSNDSNTNQAWNSQNLPPSVKVSISYAPPQQDITGNITVPQEEIKTRAIVINRFREIPYQFVYKQFADANRISDVNDQNTPAEPNAVEKPKEPNGISERTNERRRE